MHLAHVPIRLSTGDDAWITVHVRLHVAEGTLHKCDRVYLEGLLKRSFEPEIQGLTSIASLEAACRKAVSAVGVNRTSGRNKLSVTVQISHVEKTAKKLASTGSVPHTRGAERNIGVRVMRRPRIHVVGVA